MTNNFFYLFIILGAFNTASLLILGINRGIKNKYILISLIFLSILSSFVWIIPIYDKLQNTNDCIAFYSYYEEKFIGRNYSFYFLDNCDFDEDKIKLLKEFKPTRQALAPEIDYRVVNFSLDLK